MDPKTIWKRAAALLAAVGVSIFLAGGISADEGNAEAEPAAALQPTEVVVEIPEKFGTLFQVQWGGGSLFQLAGRLAALGCAMNTLWVHDGGQWHPYNRYDVPRDAALIQEFIGRYERDLPAGTFYATCADQPDAQSLQPTQIVAEIPEEYDTMFELQWGGGSLLHLKGRLATMGCIANNISFSDPTTNIRHIYNQYNTRSTDPTNKQFIQTFEVYIPAGAMRADCYRICEFTRTRPPSEWRWLYADIEHNTQDCLSYEYLRERNFYGARHSISETTPCSNDFDSRVIEYVFPVLPIHPDVCIARQQVSTRNGISAQIAFTTLNSIPVVLIYDGPNIYRNTIERDTILLKSEIHELCHVNQVWQWIQSIHLDINKPVYYWRYYFEDSPQAQEFMNLVEMTQFGNGWKLPSDSVYRNIYGKNPAELSAELCAMYLLDRMGERSSYDYETYSGGKFWEVPIRDFDTSKYLTPEVVEWLETYMILPQITEDAGDE